MKVCMLCLIEKNDNEFEKGRNQCKKCRYEKYKEQNKEYNKEYKKEYNKTDKIKEYQKEYRKINQDKIKDYFKCRSCCLFQTNPRTNYLCSYCSPTSSKRQKTKELQLKTFLDKYYTITHNKKVNLNNSCQTYFPDFLIDCGAFL